MPAVVEHLESVVSQIEPAPILMGHSAGGVFTQLLMDRGYGAPACDQLGADRGRQARAAVTDQVELPRPQEPRQPAQGRRVHLRAMALRVHEHVQRGGGAKAVRALPHPASGRVFWGSALANIHPGPDDTHVDYKNPNRAPLLFISGGEDHLMPRRSSARTRSTTRRRARSRRSSSTRAARTSCPRRRLGGDRRLRLSWATEQAACGRRDAGWQRGRDRRWPLPPEQQSCSSRRRRRSSRRPPTPPFIYELTPAEARKVLDDVRPQPIEKLRVDERWITVPARWATCACASCGRRTPRGRCR